MTKILMHVVHATHSVVRGLSGILLICSVAINFANIIGRYFFHSAFSSAEESMLFLMVGCVFLGSGVVTWSGGHIRMDIVVRAMPERIRRVLDLLSELVLLVTVIVMMVLTLPVIRQLAEFDQRSLAADIPLAIPQAMVPIGLFIMAFMVAGRLITGRGRGPIDKSSH